MRSPSDSVSLDESLEQALGLVPVPMIVVDENGAIVRANDLVAELVGWDRDELTGLKLETLIPERFRAAHPRHFDGYLQAPETRPVNTGRELWALRKDGSELPVDIALRPLTREHSTVIAATIHDLSRVRQTEDALRASERRFRIAASHTSDMIQEADLPQDHMTYYGDIDQHFGYEAGAFPRTISGLVDLIHPETRLRSQPTSSTPSLRR